MQTSFKILVAKQKTKGCFNMSELRNKMKMDLELRGLSAATIRIYLYNVSKFAEYFNKSPELLGENEIRKYLHYCTTERKLSESAVHIVYSSLKFLYTKTMGLNWNTDKIPGIKVGKTLPAVLSQSEIKEIFKVTENLKHKAILMTIYAAGLRISEASKLEISDIDSKNMQIKVREGKGKKDRYTILSETNLEILREYWKRYKPKVYLFPGMDSSKSISVRAIQLAFSDAVKKAHIKKHVSVHTLRHSFSTHLLEAGTDIFHIQRLLGHLSISTTTVYLHLRRMDLMNIKSPLDTL